MFMTHKFVHGVVAAIALGALCAGCETAGFDSLPDMGIAAAFAKKRGPEPDIQEHAPLVMPPANAALPVPGQRPQAVAANNPQWPADADQAKKQAANTNADPQCPDGSTDCKRGWLSRIGL